MNGFISYEFKHFQKVLKNNIIVLTEMEIFSLFSVLIQLCCEKQGS